MRDTAERRSDASIVVVKIGSSTLVDERGQVRRGYFAALAQQIGAVRAAGWSPIIVSSGAIACGLPLMGLTRRPTDMPSLQAAASVGQNVLAAAYAESFGPLGITTSQVLLTRHDTARRSAYLHARDALLALVSYGVVPVVNENDTTSVEQIRFGDNDTLSALVSCLVKADLSVIFSDVDGLYTANPAIDPAARKIDRVDRIDEAMLASAGGAGSSVGTGGMITKLKAARVLMTAGIPLVICSGAEPDALRRIVAGEAVGTRFAARAPRHEITNYKLWIALGDAAKGSLSVDDGARAALIDGGKSLLCVGVTAAHGSFEAGDIVDIKDSCGHVFARGKVSASFDEVELARGHSSAQMASNRLLAPLAEKPLVHRDELVVFD